MFVMYVCVWCMKRGVERESWMGVVVTTYS